ncbi:MAG: CAP domain-containing protein [Pseudomonadota bacterium]
MLRPLILLIAAALAAPVSFACDLFPTDRAATVSGYVALATSCLATPPSPAVFDADAEQEFAKKINAARAEQGLAPLDLRAQLVPAARFHSLDQIWNGTYGHDGAAGRSAGDRISALDRTLIRSFSAENVAWASGDYDPAAVPGLLHRGLMDSPGHRRNILSEDTTHMAVGVAKVRDGWAVTQLFVRVEGEMATPVALKGQTRSDLGLDAALSDWSLHDIEPFPSPEQIRADCDGGCPRTHVTPLSVEGRQYMPDGRSYRAVKLTGPSWDVIAPDPAPAPPAARASGLRGAFEGN